jgi:hypothetical protein
MVRLKGVLLGHLHYDHCHNLVLHAEVALSPVPGIPELHHNAVVAFLPFLGRHRNHLHGLPAETGDPFHLGILLPVEEDRSSQLGAEHPDQHQFPGTQNSHPHFVEVPFSSSSP